MIDFIEGVMTLDEFYDYWPDSERPKFKKPKIRHDKDFDWTIYYQDLVVKYLKRTGHQVEKISKYQRYYFAS